MSHRQNVNILWAVILVLWKKVHELRGLILVFVFNIVTLLTDGNTWSYNTINDDIKVNENKNEWQQT